MKNRNERLQLWERTIVLLMSAMLTALAFSWTPGCAGAPRSVEDASTMPEPQWEAYLHRVSVWSEAAGYTLVQECPEDAERALEFVQILAALTEPLGASPLSDAAERLPWASPLSRLVLIEIQALLEARGGIPGGGRGLALLQAVAAGVQTGVLDAATEPR